MDLRFFSRFYMKKLYYIILFASFFLLLSCSKSYQKVESSSVSGDADDCAIWINKDNPKMSTIIGNDKNENGALYVWGIDGKEIYKTNRLNEPTGVDIRESLNKSH